MSRMVRRSPLNGLDAQSGRIIGLWLSRFLPMDNTTAGRPETADVELMEAK